MKTVLLQAALLIVSLWFVKESQARLMKVTPRDELTKESLGFNQNNLILEKPQPIHKPEVQSTDECPSVTCADPEYGPGDCSSNCDKSRCKFKGCVHYGAFGPQWMPDPCTICSCNNREELCTKIECDDKLECYGYPSVVKEGDCCLSCDFGVADSECGVVPTGYKSLYVALGDQTCQKDVLLHGCDKHYIAGKDGKYYQCTPMETVHTVDMDQNHCENNVQHVTYMDTEHCVKREISPSELPQDIDFSPKSCAIFVPA